MSEEHVTVSEIPKHDVTAIIFCHTTCLLNTKNTVPEHIKGNGIPILEEALWKGEAYFNLKYFPISVGAQHVDPWSEGFTMMNLIPGSSLPPCHELSFSFYSSSSLLLGKTFHDSTLMTITKEQLKN